MKQIIRLTESDLHRMIKESVRQVLSEGSVVNNKRIFSRSGGYGNELANHGVKADDWSSSMPKEYAQIFGANNRKELFQKVIDDEMDDDDYEKIVNNYIDGAKKHNERIGKYDEKGEPQFGKEYYNSQFMKDKKSKRNEFQDFLDMLKYNKITREEFMNSSNEEKKQYKDKYNWYRSEQRRRWDDERNEIDRLIDAYNHRFDY